MNLSPEIFGALCALVSAALTSLLKDRTFDKRLALIELRLANIESYTKRHRGDYIEEERAP